MADRGARREWSIAVLFGTSHATQHFFRSIIPPLIPILALQLDLPLWQLGMLVSIYSLFSGLGQTPFGVLSDRYDRRLLLPAGLGIMSVGFGSFGLAPSLGAGLPTATFFGVTFTGPFFLMCVAMGIGGFGASVTHPVGDPLISANVSDVRKGRALGIWGSSSKLGDALAPAVVGVAIVVVPWEYVLLVSGAVGIAYSTSLVVVLGHEAVETRPPGLVGDSAAASEANEADEVDASADAEVDRGSDTDIAASQDGRDLRLFVYPILVVLLFFIARGVATKGVNTFVPAFITDVYGYSMTLFGVHLGPASLASFYFSALLVVAAGVQLVAGALSDRYDHRLVIVSFFAVAAAALWVLATVTLSPLALLLVLFVVGGSIWGSNPARDALISDISPAEFEGRTFGYLWTLTSLMGTVWPIVIGYLAETVGIQTSFRYIAFSALLGAIVIAALFSSRIYVEEPSAGASETGD